MRIKFTIYFSNFTNFYIIQFLSLVANTLSTIENNRRCWRMVGGVLVEKDVDTVRKEMDTQIANVKF
jgi:hypothetical protein